MSEQEPERPQATKDATKPPSPTPLAKLDDEARALVRIAAFLGPKHEAILNPSAPQPVKVSFTTLLAACLFAPDRTSQWLRAELEAAETEDLCRKTGAQLSDVGRALTDVPASDDAAVLAFEGETWSRSARGFVEAAAAQAARSGLSEIGVRHLVGAAIASYRDALREPFFGFLAFAFPDEAWPTAPPPDRGLVLPGLVLLGLSPHARAAVEKAGALAKHNRRLLDADHLFVGILTAVDDDDAIGPRIVAEFAAAKLGAGDRSADLLVLLQGTTGQPAPELELEGRLYVAREVLAWLGQAFRFEAAMAGEARPRVSRNHLLAVALGPRMAPAFAKHLDFMFDAVGAKRTAVAERFYEEVSKTLSSAKEDLATLNHWSLELRGKSVQETDVARATIVADVNPAVDRLDFGHEARAFALLVGSSDVAPPLSIGLFGDWGSGKTFFMHLVREAVKALDYPAGTPQPVQIEFNAWHYASADIYASLAHRLFTELQTQFRETEGGKMSLLLDKLQWTLAEKKAAQEDLELAEAKRRRAETKRDEELERVAEKRADVRELTRAVRDVASSKPAREQVEAVVRGFEKHMKLSDEARVALQDDLESFRGARVAIQALADDVRSARLRRALPTFAGLLALGLCFVLVGAKLQTAWSLPVGLVGALSAGGAWLRTARRYLDDARSAARAMAEGLRAVEVEVERTKERLDERLKVAEQALESATRAAQEKRDALSEVDAEVATLRTAVDAARPERRLQRLVERRIEEGTYSKHLGIIETLRDDFATLSDLLRRDADKDRREKLLKEFGLTEESLPNIQRIVLYIDDLDRCPADKVSDVLQAVHLFLAFPLFVVVVAVDARWASRSLIDTHPQLRDGAASPADYLEKIFQIPFWVAPMDRYGAKRILRDLWANTPEAPAPRVGRRSPAPPPGVPASARADSSSTAASAGAAGVGSGTSPQPGPSTRDAVPLGPAPLPADELRERRTITAEERLFAEELASYLGTSPRRLKRFANLYRLVKASMSVKEWDGYDEDDARAVLTLLALLTGAPNLAPDVIEDILSDRWTETGPSSLANSEMDPDELARGIGLMKHAVRGPVLKRWAGAVARYSFRRVSLPYHAG